MSLARAFDYLSAEELIHMHAVEVPGAGVLDLGRVHAIAGTPQQTFDGEDLYPSLAEKAAALAFGLAKGHAFKDGNKRMAALALPVFVGMNGHRLNMDDVTMVHIILDVVAGAMTQDDLAQAIDAALVAPPEDFES